MKKMLVYIYQRVHQQDGRFILYSFFFVAALMAVISLIASATDVSVASLTRDPMATALMPPYTGVISNIGILMLCAAVAIALFTARMIRESSPGFSRFLLHTGLFTLLLLLDDLFMFHEVIFPWYCHIPQKWVIFSYGILLLHYLIVNRRVLIVTDFMFLFTAAFAGFISVALDFLHSEEIYSHFVWEDGFKLLGIVLYSLWIVRQSAGWLKKDMELSAVIKRKTIALYPVWRHPVQFHNNKNDLTLDKDQRDQYERK